jgi:HD superfamily phosphodiesterase
MAPLRDLARALAGEQLAFPLPRRWIHVQAVGVKAEEIGFLLDEPDRDYLAAAGWLHDVGYAPAIAVTGFHPLDGARWLRSIGFDERVVGLVAHHSCAYLEADERGLLDVLVGEFDREESSTADALWSG